MTILGFPTWLHLANFLFKRKDITHLPINERVKLGINVALQNLPVIRGVKLDGIIHFLMPDKKKVSELLGKLNFPPEFLERDINLGFSGGEVKNWRQWGDVNNAVWFKPI